MISLKKALYTTLASAAMTALCATNAFAGDTTELLDHGVVEVAPTFSIDNIHDGKPAVVVGTAVGYGVTDFLTVTTGFEIASGEALAGLGWGFDVDLLFTPVDTENVDLDLHVDFAIGETGLDIVPGLELNFDTDNDQGGFGAYLRLDLPISSGWKGNLNDDDKYEDLGKVKTDLGLDLTLGMYYTIMEGNQLFLEGGLSVANLAESYSDRELGGFVSLGYNTEIIENFELTTEVAINIPEDGDGTNATLSIGGIFDLPLL